MLSIVCKIKTIALFLCIFADESLAMEKKQDIFKVTRNFENSEINLAKIGTFCDAHAGQFIIVVDDNSVNQLVLKRMLDPHPLLIFDLGSDLLRVEPKDFLASALLIILDNDMPKIHGTQVMQMLQDRHFVELNDKVTKPPVIFNTSDTMEPPVNLYFKRVLLDDNKNNKEEILRVVAEIQETDTFSRSDCSIPLAAAGNKSPKREGSKSFREPSRLRRDSTSSGSAGPLLGIGVVGNASPKKERSQSFRMPTQR